MSYCVFVKSWIGSRSDTNTTATARMLLFALCVSRSVSLVRACVKHISQIREHFSRGTYGVACGNVLPNFVPNGIPLSILLFLVHCFTATPSSSPSRAFFYLFALPFCYSAHRSSSARLFRHFHAKWIFKWWMLLPLCSWHGLNRSSKHLPFQVFWMQHIKFTATSDGKFLSM